MEMSVSVLVAMVWSSSGARGRWGRLTSSVESIEPSTISLLPTEFGPRSAAVSEALKTSAPVTASAAIVGFG